MGRITAAGVFVAAFTVVTTLPGGIFAHNAAAIEPGWERPLLLGYGQAPVVAVDSDGKVMAVWEWANSSQSNLNANRFLPGPGWEVPTLLATSDGQLDGPSLAMNANGSASLVWSEWMRDGSGYDIRIFGRHFTPGRGWSTPAEISDAHSMGRVNASAGAHVVIDPAQVALDESGHAIAMWARRNGTDEIWVNRYVPDSGWGSPLLIGTVTSGLDNTFGRKVVMDSAGNAIVAWSGSVGGTDSVFVSRYDASTGWRSPRNLAADIGPMHAFWLVHSVDVAMNARGDAVLVWEVADGSSHRIMARNFLPDAGWGNATAIFSVEGGAHRPVAALDASGNAIVVWHVGWTSGDLYASRFTPYSGWGNHVRISEPAGCAALATHHIDIGEGGRAVVTWSEGDECGKRIWAVRFVNVLGWGRPEPIGQGLWFPKVSVGPAETATVVWSSEIDNERQVWATQLVSSSSTLFELDKGLRETQNALAKTQTTLEETRSELDATQEVLAEARHLLEVTMAGLTGASWAVLFLLFLQVAFGAAIAILFVQNRSLRRGIAPVRRESTSSRSPTAWEARILARTQREWPASLPGGPVSLTSKERILLHLLDTDVGKDRQEVSQGQIQAGIAAATGVDLRHFAQYARPLIGGGLVQERMAHVQGVLQRRKAYDLTADGVRRALGIRNRVQASVVRVRDSAGMREATIAEVLAETGGSKSTLEIVREAVEEGQVDLRVRGVKRDVR